MALVALENYKQAIKQVLKFLIKYHLIIKIKSVCVICKHKIFNLILMHQKINKVKIKKNQFQLAFQRKVTNFSNSGASVHTAKNSVKKKLCKTDSSRYFYLQGVVLQLRIQLIIGKYSQSRSNLFARSFSQRPASLTSLNLVQALNVGRSAYSMSWHFYSI